MTCSRLPGSSWELHEFATDSEPASSPCFLHAPVCRCPVGETEETALPRAQDVIAACIAVHNSVMQLLDGIEMPASNVWFWPGK
jgi:hypothetical protein